MVAGHNAAKVIARCKTEFGYGLGGEVEAVVAGSVGVESLLPELISAATAVDAT
jgi:hypothetical protein